MSIASDLTRIKNAKTAIRQAIIDKGVEVPEASLISTYSSYIDQISSIPAGPTGDGTLADLKLALSTNNPAEYYPIGTELPDTYDGKSNPLIVAQYLNSTNNSAYSGAEGVILTRKYAEPMHLFSPTASSLYTTSSIKSFLDTTYLDNCSVELKAVISDISIPYYDGNSMVSVDSKWFLQGGKEINSNSPYGQEEGFAWDYWKQQTDNKTSNNATAGRVIRTREGVEQPIWLRSRYDSEMPYLIGRDGAIAYGVSANGKLETLPACFIAKETS